MVVAAPDGPMVPDIVEGTAATARPRLVSAHPAAVIGEKGTGHRAQCLQLGVRRDQYGV